MDSNGLHVASWKEVARRHGYDCPDPEHIGKCGMRTVAVIRDLLGWPVSEEAAERLGGEKEELYQEWLRRDGISPVPGVAAFLEKAFRAGFCCAVGSSAPRANLDLCLEVLGMGGFFLATVSGEDVRRGKPAPDIFLRAAERLGVPPANCLVFEDAPAGVQAAHAAGMKVVALLTSHRRDELGQADRIAGHFDDLDPERLATEIGP